jgi:hypothetical protein
VRLVDRIIKESFFIFFLSRLGPKTRSEAKHVGQSISFLVVLGIAFPAAYR